MLLIFSLFVSATLSLINAILPRSTDIVAKAQRCTKGEQLRMGFPHGHRKTTALAAGLRNTGMVAPMVIDGPTHGAWFEAYVSHFLVPTLKPGDVVILNNLSNHKRPAART
jgi:hypothetical protein